MSLGASNYTTSRGDISSQLSLASVLADFPTESQLETDEQIRRFELLRLAFFVLKLRKITQEAPGDQQKSKNAEYNLRCSLLRHAIFQQVVALTRLDAREQALQLINTCRR